MEKERSLTEKAAEMVAEMARTTPMTSSQMAEALKKTYQELAQERTGETQAPLEVPKKAAKPKARRAKKAPKPKGLDAQFETLTFLRENPKRSVKKDIVICLECGGRFKILTARHLKTHGLDRPKYLEKWGLDPDQNLVSKTYSAKRSQIITEAWAKRDEAPVEEEPASLFTDPADRPAEEEVQFKPRVILRKRKKKE